VKTPNHAILGGICIFFMLGVVGTACDSSMLPDITALRPYSEDSVWNIPIGSAPQYDPNSVEMVATIGLSGDGRITSDPSQFSYPIYYIDDATPRWDIPCTMYDCTIVRKNGEVEKTSVLKNVPIPPDAQPSQGHDAQIIIIDKITFNEYDLWHVERTASGWKIANGTIYNATWDGISEEYGSRGAGVPYLAGLIRPWEILQGRIEHVIAFGYSEPAKNRCVFPASKTDGQSSLPYAIPEGARLQLDPSLTDSDFRRFGLDRTGRIIAKALQEYGMILVDYAGRPKIYAEDLTANPYATMQWSNRKLNLTEETIANIPYESFKVLALPEAYWDQGSDDPLFGECYDYPDTTSSSYVGATLGYPLGVRD
jgi:hypothetical protein